MTRVPTAVWFLFSEEEQPLGQVYRYDDEAAPTAGAVLSDGARWKRAEVAEFEELLSTCVMRRFRVVVRVLE